MFWKMPKIHSLDFVLLEASFFGVSQGYTGRYIGPRTAGIFGILNLSLTLAEIYLMFSGGYFNGRGDLSINYLFRMVYYCVAISRILFIQTRSLFKRPRIAYLVKELARLDELSTWRGDVSGCIGRMLVHLATCILHQNLPAYRIEWEGWRIATLCFYWSNYSPSAAVEFLGQMMMLFQHEFKVLSQMTEDIENREDLDMVKLRALNRRHASLIALSNKLSRITGMDSLFMIETERLLLLINIFVKVNLAAVVPVDWYNELVGVIFYSYRIERITHCCFRGHRVMMETDRFVSTLDKIDPLDPETDEFFTEFQIFRKQVRLRKLHFDCNRFLKLDIKLIFRISKDLLTLIIILVQLSTHFPTGSSKPSNATEDSDQTEDFLAFSYTQSNSSSLV